MKTNTHTQLAKLHSFLIQHTVKHKAYYSAFLETKTGGKNTS